MTRAEWKKLYRKQRMNRGLDHFRPREKWHFWRNGKRISARHLKPGVARAVAINVRELGYMTLLMDWEILDEE